VIFIGNILSYVLAVTGALGVDLNQLAESVFEVRDLAHLRLSE
jgi:hypothetical protein